MYHSSGKLNTGFVGANMLRVEKRDKLGWLGRQAVSGAAAGARRAEGIRRAVRTNAAREGMLHLWKHFHCQLNGIPAFPRGSFRVET